MSSHASYVWAMNSLLVNRQGDRLAVFTNLPAEWENVSFENLTTPDGLQVSAKLKNRKIVKLEVKNLSQQEREVDLLHPGQIGIRFSLPPGGMYQRPL
jgi:hypothetical protein